MVNKIKGSIYYFLDLINLSISVLLCLAFPISSLSLLLHKRSMKLISIKNLNNIRSRFSTESVIDPNILADFIKEDALTPSLKRPEKKESTTIKLYFNLAKVFTNAALKLGDHPSMVYQFHLYLVQRENTTI